MVKNYTRDELHTLDEIAATHLPADLKDGVRWLANKARSGDIEAVKIGRTWYMTDDHVALMFDRLTNKREAPTPPVQPDPASDPAPAVSLVDGLSERSRRRLRRVQ